MHFSRIKPSCIDIFTKIYISLVAKFYHCEKRAIFYFLAIHFEKNYFFPECIFLGREIFSL